MFVPSLSWQNGSKMPFSAERIGTKLHVPATILHAVGDWLATAPADLDVVGPLMEAGVDSLAASELVQ